MNPTLLTRSGKYLDILNPKPEQIDISDIAWGLSHLCRFNGQITHFYSVAQHSLYVASFCSKENALYGLLHDATEAYIGDVISPLKQLLPEYKAIEKNLESVILQKFGLEPTIPKEVKEIDTRMLITERNQLFNSHLVNKEEWVDFLGVAPLDLKINVDYSMSQWYNYFMMNFTLITKEKTYDYTSITNSY